MSDSLRAHGLEPTRLLCPWNSPGTNIGVGSHSLLQGIFLTQGSNPGLLHYRQVLYHLSPQRSPKTFEGVEGVCNFLGSVSLQQKFEVMYGPVLLLNFIRKNKG